MKAAIFTISTGMYNTKGESAAANILKRTLEQVGIEVRGVKILPAERKTVGTVIEQLSKSGAVDLILTTGSNGYTSADCAPDAVADVVERVLPGIPEAIRAYNLRYSKKAMLDRSVAGICNNTLILNLPEKAKAAQEDLDYILPELVRVMETIE